MDSTSIKVNLKNVGLWNGNLLQPKKKQLKRGLAAFHYNWINFELFPKLIIYLYVNYVACIAL